MIRRRFMKMALGTSVASSGPALGADSTSNPSSRAVFAKAKPRIMYYHDSRHPLIYMYEPPMQKEEFEAAVDELAGTPVEALMFCLGDGRTMFHDTKVGELWGHSVKKWPHLIFRRAHQNAKDLIDAGHDPLRIVCDQAHAAGLLLYPTLLVNQGRRGTREEDVRGSDFRWNNRHLEIGAGGGVAPNHPGFTCLDFKHEEVRRERFALIEEVLTRYPVDGFELQLNYISPGPYFFRPNEVEAGRRVMTAWIEKVYRAVKASGAERELAIRVPASLETSYSLGLDVREWMRQGIVDVLIGETYWSLVDSQADFRPLVAAAKGSRCRIHAAVNSLVSSDRLTNATKEITRAVVCNYWNQGIEGLYLTQWFAGFNWPYRASFYGQLREVAHPDVMAPKDKIYFVPTQGSYLKAPTEPTLPLPVDLKVNEPIRLDITIADDLPRWDKAGRLRELLLRLRFGNATELDRLSFRLNGKVLPDSLFRKLNEMYRMSGVRRRDGGYWFICRLDRVHWPSKGKNTIEVLLTQRDPDVIPQIRLCDVEIEIKYLLGKNFHGGLDPDLGPTDRNEV